MPVLKIIRIGNSLGVRLPKGLLDTLDLKENDEIKMTSRKKEINLILTKKELP